MHVPVLDRRSSFFANHEKKVALRTQIPTMESQKRAANFLLHMTDVAGRVCMSAGKDVVGNIDGVAHTLRILRERFAPDAIGSILQDVAKFTYLKRADQNADTYLLRQKAEARMLMCSGFPDEFVSVLCIQSAALSENEKTSALASLHRTPAFLAVSAQKRRLFGPCGYAPAKMFSYRRIWTRRMKTKILRHGRPIVRRNAPRMLGEVEGGMGNRRGGSPLRRKAPGMVLIVELGCKTGVIPAKVSIAMLLGVRERRILIAALFRPCGH